MNVLTILLSFSLFYKLLGKVNTIYNVKSGENSDNKKKGNLVRGNSIKQYEQKSKIHKLEGTVYFHLLFLCLMNISTRPHLHNHINYRS